MNLYHYIGSKVHQVMATIYPKYEMRRFYYGVFKEYPDLENPTNLIEIIYWLQLHSDTTMWTKCADKYRMREYVKDCGLEGYLPQLYGKWDNPEDIDFSQLPNELVFKANNGCGTVKIIKDLKTVDKRALVKEMKKWISTKYGYPGAQLHYLKIHPCIIAEQLLHQDEKLNSYSPHSMVDFKVWCINGQPESVLITYNRNRNHHDLDLFSLSWERLSHYLNFNGSFGYTENALPKPNCLEELLRVASILAKPFPEVRTDFYIVDNKPVIGELTFTAGYGNLTKEYYSYLGSLIDLSRVPKIK